MVSEMKEFLYKFLFLWNILALPLMVLQVMLHNIPRFEFLHQIRALATGLVFIFLIWNILIWGKHDKKPGHILLLVFLNGFYTIYYAGIVKRNRWY